MKQFLFFTLILFIMSDVQAQTTPPKPGTAIECSQFDFWLGSWNLTYNDTVHATNHITKEMNGCVLHEHFDDPKNSYKGESWSVYSAAKKVWQQTWVDDQGAYIALTGEFKDGRMTLFTEPALTPAGLKMQYRMLYYNITPDSFDWDWASTTDDGKTWKLNWHIHYDRKK